MGGAKSRPVWAGQSPVWAGPLSVWAGSVLGSVMSLPVLWWWAWPCPSAPPHARRESPDKDLECPHYDVRVGGANLGCVLDNVPVLRSLMVVTVKGNSSAGPVSCTDAAFDLQFVGEPTAQARDLLCMWDRPRP